MSLSKITGQSSASKRCAMCCAWPAAAGRHGPCDAISLTDASSSVWSAMPLSGRRSVPQNSGMVHHAWLMNCPGTTSKPSPPVCVVRGFGQRLRGKLLPLAESGMYPRRKLYQPGSDANDSVQLYRVRLQSVASSQCLWRTQPGTI